MMMPFRHPFSASAPENTPLFLKNQYNYIRFDSLNPPFHYPRTHDSAKKLHCVPNIPEFQHSNWGEAPNLIKTRFYLWCNIADQQYIKSGIQGKENDRRNDSR